MPIVFEYRPDEDLLDDIAMWLHLPALRTLVERFGGEWPTTDDLAELAHRLYEFSGVWDRRSGQTRLDLEQLEDGDERISGLIDLVEELGMVTPAPPKGGVYDWVLILGGLAGGCRRRVEFGAALLADHTIDLGQGACLLGSFRELHPDELLIAREYTSDARTEVDLLRALADREFPSDMPWQMTLKGDPLGAPRIASFRALRAGPVSLRLYASASSDPNQRPANTADTYRQFADDVRLRSPSRLLLVTTQIYARYQHWDGVRILGLPHRVSLETVGVPVASLGGPLTPAGYLQEVRSAIRSAVALVDAIAY